MTTADRDAGKAGRLAFLPPEVAEFLHRRLVELGGLALFALGAGLILAVASYSPADPSLNTATGAQPANLLARPGAYIADLLVQGCGLAAYLPGIAIALWGMRVMVHLGLPRLWLALPAVPVALAAVAAVAAHDTAGAGGLIGGLIVAKAEGLRAALLPEIGGWIIALALWMIAIGAAIPAIDLRPAEVIGLWRGAHVGAKGAATAGVTLVAVWRAFSAWIAKDRVADQPKSDDRIEPEIDLGPAPPAPAAVDDDVPLASDRVEVPKAKSRAGKRATAERQAALDLDAKRKAGFELPPLALLAEPPARKASDQASPEALEQNARLLEQVLADFDVQGKIVKVRPGPVVTLYELEPEPGTKSAKVINLSDDIARSMSAVAVRAAVVPGRNVIGIELPNARRESVALREILASEAFESTGGRLNLALGKDIGGAPIIADLARMPHLLVAGTTGSGKSVGVNAMILSLLYRLTPAQVRLIMVDPKMLELSVYDGIPHLLAPVVTEAGKAVVALKWAVREMEERYRRMSALGVRNIDGYNERIAQALAKGEIITRKLQTGIDPETRQPTTEEKPLDLVALPWIVIVVDEFSDLMMVAGKDVEAAVLRLAQMARAAGIHLVMATQRPSVDVITGTIKANFPTRISFQVTSKIDSRTILGTQGAEQLLGSGDMLYMSAGGRIQRVHGPFVSDREVAKVADFLRAQGQPEYLTEVTEDPEEFDPAAMEEAEGGDDLYRRAAELVRREGKASTSFVQRHLQIGYNRAARIIEQMEKEGIVSPANHVGKREVIG